MKILIAFFLSLSLPAQAEAPPATCDAASCPGPMGAIAADFDRGAGLSAGLIPFVASGECYHRSPGDEPTKAQYAYTFLDAHEGRVYMGGAFSFFYPENPYRDLTVERARAQLADDLYSESHLVSLEADHAFSDMNPGGAGESIVRYWLRESGGSILLIGQWGRGHTVFCRLGRH